MRWIAVALALALGGCATSRPSGNEFGGVVMGGGLRADRAYASAQEHCAQYGKQARVTAVTVRDYSGDPVLFDCVR